MAESRKRPGTTVPGTVCPFTGRRTIYNGTQSEWGETWRNIFAMLLWLMGKSSRDRTLPAAPKLNGPHAPSGRITLGRRGFAKISAVEGVQLTAEMERDFREFDRKRLSPQERRQAIAVKYGKKSG